MIKTKSTKTKYIITILIILVMGILLAIGGFLIYASDYYPADEIAIQIMQQQDRVEIYENLTIVSPPEKSDVGFIFYPGAKVENIAYLPLLEKLTENGITCVLVKMPLNMAIFDADAAEEVFDKLPEIKNWYIGGHSMGGAMASDYASKNRDKVKGLVLLGAYIYGDYPPDQTLTIYGTYNSDLEKYIDYTENIVEIEGGNHAQFGNYGQQKGDPVATITSEEQQDIAVEAIIEFMNAR